MTSNPEDTFFTEALAAAPCAPMGWKVLVCALPAKQETDGGIALPEQIVEAERHQVRVGVVVDLGTFAYQARTKAGIDLSKETRKPGPGSWVLYNPYAGIRIPCRGKEYLLIDDIHIAGRPYEPYAVREAMY